MKKNAFTLIELIVGMTIFIIVISVVLSLFMTGLRGQRNIIAQQNVQDNARYLLGFIAKELRMGEIDSVSNSTLEITRPDGESVTYVFNSADKTIERTDSSTSGPINSDNVLITGSFYGLGIGDDNQQPRITIIMKVETIGEKEEEKVEINIQTTLSQRNLES